ncbi:alpha/beta hydrolase [Pseudobdellovibrio exovorus]|uniref:Serine esterase, putative n=1 Tax=Pseudobdellovibrio exovorus JSS TaxID=1184267 RepID=M4VAI0_9BACT|nr:serine esterase [Pseudobdellovibrio exovorus]AGH96238.1 serine esterase, putative [Pseudobdellovibrio exovorus JSS]
MRQAGPLKAIEIYQDPEAKWVILLHGYGADASDLASLQSAIPLNKDCNWLFPDAPLSVPIGPGWTGRAWWNIRMTELPGDWTQLRPPDMDPAVDKVMKMMASMKFDWKDVIIGGFSQGAMLATEVFLKAPVTPAGLICMSGTLLSQPVWTELVAARKGASVLMSHGEMDPVLPHKGSVLLQKFFEENGIKTQFVSFRGGHEIPFQVIEKMKTYISERL